MRRITRAANDQALARTLKFHRRTVRPLRHVKSETGEISLEHLDVLLPHELPKFPALGNKHT
jgi:hypothetical protein